MLNKARIRNKLIQQFYSPKKDGLLSKNTIKMVDEIDKELDKTLSGVFGKKKRKKSAGKKSDDSKEEGKE